MTELGNHFGVVFLSLPVGIASQPAVFSLCPEMQNAGPQNLRAAPTGLNSRASTGGTRPNRSN